MIERVISGGQTGADMAGLKAARSCGIATGGTATKGWRTENGPRPDLVEYGLVEDDHAAYPFRTKKNVRNSDATLIIALKVLDGGSMLTSLFANELRRPCIHVKELTPETQKKTAEWIIQHNVRILNIAGNRESKSPGLQVAATQWLQALLVQIAATTSATSPQEGQRSER